MMLCCVLLSAALLPAILCQSPLNAEDKVRYNTCDDVLKSGRYKDSGSYIIFLNSTKPIEVYCRFEMGRAYVSIMQQKYGSVNFQRGWNDYENGFGSTTSGDYWSGLRKIKSLTDAGYHIMTVTLQDWTNTIKTIQYNYFVLGPASDRYRLHIGGYQSSLVLPDDFSHNDNMPFSTYDRPDANQCAYHQRAGWWYNYCSYALPTGRYYVGGPYTPSGGFYDGIYYNDWHGFGYSLRYIRIDLTHF